MSMVYDPAAVPDPVDQGVRRHGLLRGLARDRRVGGQRVPAGLPVIVHVGLVADPVAVQVDGGLVVVLAAGGCRGRPSF